MRRCLAPGARRAARATRPDGRGATGGRRARFAAVVTAGVLLVTAVPALAAAAEPGPSSTTTAGSTPATSVVDTTSTSAPPSTSPAAPGTTAAPASTTTTAPATTTTQAPPAAPAATGGRQEPGNSTPSAGRLPDGTDPALGGASTPADASTVAAGPWLVGPDVASYQHPGGAAINWSAVAAGGSSFAFIKATEGTRYTNPYYRADWAGAGGAGLYRAPYHFAQPALPISTAADQATYMASVIGPINGARDLPPVLDIEITNGLGPQDLADWTVTFVQTLQNLTGRTPIIYTGPYFWKTSVGNTTRLSGYPLWVASWTSADNPGALFGGWTSWAFWQYTDAGASSGIQGTVDMNRACCGIGGLAQLAGHPTTAYLRNSNTTGTADWTTEYQVPPGGRVLTCDFNGDGIDTLAIVQGGAWYVTNSLQSGPPQMVFGFGQPGDIPVCGDWDGNGTQTPGVVRNGVWYLSNSTGSPRADMAFGFGNPGDIPVVGDWDGSGRDKPGVFRKGVWFLSYSTGRSVADAILGYGNTTDTPVVGDWDGNGTDSPGVFRDGSWYLVNSLAKGIADVKIGYGNPSDTPIPGHWWPGLPSTVGIARQS